MIDIASMDAEELKEYLTISGEAPYHALQLFKWIHKKLVTDFDEMTNLRKSLRDKLSNECSIAELKVLNKQVSATDGTNKFLFGLEDGNCIESVLMKYSYGNSVCISSQIGCRMGCRFCASTIDGMVRNLTASEMLAEVYSIQRLTGERVSRVVVMGSGEPLDNYDNLLKFIKILSCKDGLNISQRNITVSTCGLVPQLLRLAGEKLQITLALSLHAPNDKIRKEIMPIALKYSIRETLDACRKYFSNTGRRISVEYSLISGVNDSAAHAAELASLIRPFGVHVNLIPVNPVEERSFKRSGSGTIAAFKNTLEKGGINVTIRRELGSDIDGACGQLRRNYKDTLNQNY